MKPVRFHRTFDKHYLKRVARHTKLKQAFDGSHSQVYK